MRPPAADARLDPYFAALQQLPAAPDGVRVLRTEDTAAIFDAERAVADARALADTMTADVMRTIDEARETGYREGKEQAARELASELTRLQQQTLEFYQDANRTIADLAVKIAEKLIGKVDRDAVLVQTVREAIAEHLQDEPYCIQVATDVRATMRAGLDQIRRENPKVRLPSLRVDARLPKGRAVLLTRFGSVDLDVESQLRAMRDGLAAGIPAMHVDAAPAKPKTAP